MCLACHKTSLLPIRQPSRNVLIPASVYLSKYCFGEDDGSRRLHVPEECHDAGAVAGRDQLPADKGNATADEGW